ncbi:MAG: ABC transporter permease subunit [Gemmatimonadetes bacterium]|nr:MAG: ABC transporter permease subunit [Gemmatimonadota bacterium]
MSFTALKPSDTRNVPSPPPLWHRRFWLLSFGVALVFSLGQTGFFREELVNYGGVALIGRVFGAALHPDLSLSFLRLTLDATLVTLAYAVCGTAFSLIFGSLLALPASQIFWKTVFRHDASSRRARVCWLTVRTLLAIPRGIHEFLWGLIFINILGLDPISAILAITIPFGSIVAKVYSETLDETSPVVFNALLNSGAKPFPALFYALIPQAIPDLVSYAFYRFECAIRAAAVLGVIGVGGLGYQILLSLQSLKYQELWTLFFALMVLSGGADLWSSVLRKRLTQEQSDSASIRFLVRGSILLAIVLLPVSLGYVQPDFGRIFSERTGRLIISITDQAFPPRYEPGQTGYMLALSMKTLAMSLLAMVFASFGGMVFAFFAARNLLLPGGIMIPEKASLWQRFSGRLVWVVSRMILLFTRAIPAPIWALICLFVLFPGILPGAIALGLYNFGILGRLMAEVVEHLDPRPLNALKHQGASGWQVFFYGVLPSAMPRFLAYSLYRWEVCLRATVIVGLVGAGGLGRLLTEQLSSFDYRGLGVTLAYFIALTFFVDLVSAFVRKTWH